MKNTARILLILTLLAGMLFVAGAAKFEPQLGPKLKLASIDLPKEVTILEDTWDVVYGDSCPKIRFAVGGVEMQEGVDFEYRYRPSGTRFLREDYRDFHDGDCFFDLVVYIKNVWANDLLNKPDYQKIYDHPIGYFYVYPHRYWKMRSYFNS